MGKYLELYQNKEHHIYLPKDDSNPQTLGEEWFFKGKFWKLQVMMGYWWSDSCLIKTGFSIFNIRAAKRVNNLLDRLDALGIEYKTNTSEANWQYRVNISAKKRNLELIDKLYDEFYNRTIKEHSGWYIHENSIMDSTIRFDEEIGFHNRPDSEFELIK